LTTSKKLIVVGPGGHGKDVFAGILGNTWDLSVASSSYFVVMRAVFPTLGKDYDNFEDMYADRRNRRVEWMHLIREYNKPAHDTPGLTRLARELFALHDVYVGPRNREEFLAVKDAKLFDLAVWVDASERVGGTDDSLQIGLNDCDISIDNNGTPLDLRIHALRFGEAFYGEIPQHK